MNNSKVVMIIRDSEKEEVFDELGDIMKENGIKYEIMDDTSFDAMITQIERV